MTTYHNMPHQMPAGNKGLAQGGSNPADNFVQN
jgi:hypothetical protein